MKVKVPRQISLGQIIAIITVMTSVFTGVGYVLTIKYGGENNSAQIIEISNTQKERVLEVNSQFEKINSNVSQVKSDVSDLKKDVAVTQANQTVMMQQISQMQLDMRNFYAMILQEKSAALYGFAPTNASYRTHDEKTSPTH